MIESVLSVFNLSSVWQLLLMLLIVVLPYAPIIVIARKRGKSLLKTSMVYFLVAYIAIVYYATVISRVPLEEDVNYLTSPFWSYRLPMKFIPDVIIREIIINVVMLMPVGVALTAVLKKHRVLISTAAAFVLSLSIELLQLVTKTGFSEFDDIFHNTLGVLIVSVLYILTEKIIKRAKKKESSL